MMAQDTRVIETLADVGPLHRPPRHAAHPENGNASRGDAIGVFDQICASVLADRSQFWKDPLGTEDTVDRLEAAIRVFSRVALTRHRKERS